MKKNKISWKQNLRKIPGWIMAKIVKFSNKDFLVACVKKISVNDIIANKYKHLSIQLKDGKVQFPSTLIPKEEVGKYSKRNINGIEVVRKDLPMRTKKYSFYTPNFGDWSKGSHEVEFEKEIYQRDYIAPGLIEIKIELIGEEIKGEKFYVLKFIVNEVLSKIDKKYQEKLLCNLNLLQENVGIIDVFLSEATLDDYLKTIYLEWEILPTGERNETISKIFSGFRSSSDELRKKIASRYDLLLKFNPIAFIRGTNGFRRYFGAQFTDKLVAFENLEYGNAIYVMFEDWAKLSKMSRIDLLSGKMSGFTRIVHRKGWEKQLGRAIEENLT